MEEICELTSEKLKRRDERWKTNSDIDWRIIKRALFSEYILTLARVGLQNYLR